MAVDKRMSAAEYQRPPVAIRQPKPSRLLEYFVILEIICQIALLSPALASARVVFRSAVFGFSLGLLFVLPGQGRFHPAAKASLFVLAILAVSMLNPGIVNMVSATAQVGLYLAILAPLFWVPRLRIDLSEMRRVIFLQWAFQAVSATVGILQVYFPARFQFAISTVMQSNGSGYLGMLQFHNVYGQEVYRPMGLTDTPGGAAAAGFFAVLFGAAFFLMERRKWMQAAYAGAMLVGMAAIYLSQVRVMLVMEVVCMTTFVALMSWRAARTQGQIPERETGGRRVAYLAAVLALVAAAGFTWAVAVGGTAIAERVNTLTTEDPTQVYQENRGQFLAYTVEDVLPAYPLGAGPGRWGMMFYYFGDPANTSNLSLWSEIQWTGWLYDGGVPLVLAYALAIALALRIACKIALNDRFGDLGTLAALVFAYDVGVLAATFDSNYFVSGGGLDFWILNAMLFSAARHAWRLPVPAREAAR